MPSRKKIAPKKITHKKPRLSSRSTQKKTKVMSVAGKREAVKKTFTIRSLHLKTHLIIAGSAIAVLLVLSYFDRNTFATLASFASEQKNIATIGLEYEQPLNLQVLFAKKESDGYVSVRNATPFPIHISAPSSWSRTEVTGAPLSLVTGDIPVFGFTRWSLPPNAGVRFFLQDVPDAVFFDSASARTAAVDMKTVDLKSSLVNNRVILVQKQALVNLWGAEE